MSADGLIRAFVAFPKLRFYFPDITPTRSLVLTHEAISVLWVVSAFTTTGGASQGHVRRLLGLPPDRFSQILRPLLKACIATERDRDDGRNRRLKITKQGRDILRAAEYEYQTLFEQRFADLGPGERDACADAMMQLAASISHLLNRGSKK
jgi:DNA-binding MarR family transcriptional regulator